MATNSPPDSLVPAERGTRWRCRQRGAERAAARRVDIPRQRDPGSAATRSCASETSATEAPSHPGRLCCSRKPNVRYSSRLLSRRGRLLEPGSVMQDWPRRAASFQADCTARHIGLLGSTRGSWILGSGSWDWTRPATGRTHSGERRRPWSTAGPRTCGPFSCC